jgi:hypothetical protein
MSEFSGSLAGKEEIYGERRRSGSLAQISAYAGTLFDRYGLALAVGTSVLLPLKLALMYCCFLPLLLLWNLASFGKLDAAWQLRTSPAAPLIFFMAAVVLSAPFGVNPARSLLGVVPMIFYATAIPAFRDVARRGHVLTLIFSLLIGQTISSFHSVLSESLSGIPEMFIGKVTESGQLAIVLPLAIGAAFYFDREDSNRKGSPRFLDIAWCLLNITLLVAFGFSKDLGLSSRTVFALGAMNLCSLTAASYRSTRTRNQLNQADVYRFRIISIVIPILTAALIVNLKRGPWAGVFVAAALLFFTLRRRLLAPFLALCLVAVFFEPVRDRLQHSSAHFYISGGRSIIWQIGGELATRFPLGLGYHNSRFLQQFSPEIPAQLKHFHSNPLNILVETGWIGLMMYSWWICSMIRAAFRQFGSKSPAGTIALGIGCSLVSWQVAGLVEYNFGDSEVVFIAYLACGLVCALGQLTSEEVAAKKRTAPDALSL